MLSSGRRRGNLPSSFLCHSEHGAPRSESEINMLAGGKHTAIQRRRVEESVIPSLSIVHCPLSILLALCAEVEGDDGGDDEHHIVGGDLAFQGKHGEYRHDRERDQGFDFDQVCQVG